MSIDSTGIAFTAYTTCTAHTAHKCSIPKLHIWGAGGWGWGWVLLGPMGLVVAPNDQKLYGLVRKPLATLRRAAREPLRHASNEFNSRGQRRR